MLYITRGVPNKAVEKKKVSSLFPLAVGDLDTRLALDKATTVPARLHGSCALLNAFFLVIF